MYGHAKLFVQSSELEGLSISLLEAMAHGLPIIASDIAANRQAVADTALYFKSKDIDDLEIKLKLALEDNERMERLGREAKARANEYYSWDKISEDTLNIYKK